jgi:hypothetical protein
LSKSYTGGIYDVASRIYLALNRGGGEHHGCPYKTFGAEGLRAALGRVVQVHKLKTRGESAYGFSA